MYAPTDSTAFVGIELQKVHITKQFIYMQKPAGAIYTNARSKYAACMYVSLALIMNIHEPCMYPYIHRCVHVCLVVLTGASTHVHVCLQNCVPQEIDRQAYKEIHVDVEL